MSFQQAVEHRRTHYDLSAKNPISDAKIEQILEHAVKYTPTAFNSQSGRLVLIKGEEHRALWAFTLELLQKITPEVAFQATEKKIRAFEAAYATILFFEDQDTVQGLQVRFPLYADRFPGWSEQQTGILQYIVWMALDEAGIGANLQHYDPLIDEMVQHCWGIPKSWKLTGEMPFGLSSGRLEDKTFLPVKDRIRVFGA